MIRILHYRFSIFLAITVFALAACSTPAQKATDANQTASAKNVSRPEKRLLSETVAIERGALVSHVHYGLFFDIRREEEFCSRATVVFNLNDTSDPLEIDFHQGNILSLVVNDIPIFKPDYNGFYLTVAKEALVQGSNRVTIEFTHPYSDTGSGLYRFEDPEDGKVYLYTNFEPFFANRLFPCFDQPDLKATYKLQVLAPESWTVISSVREHSVRKQGEDILWDFPTSQRFSTYLFSLHAGPYRVWSSQAGKIPLRLFARQSIGKYVLPDSWFTVTQQGLEFFPEYFGYPYPFKKYDQIIVPDFNAGAMENVAAVTFSERFVKRGTPTREDLERKANVILHEMAHMWFGDLVTMKWWNDLWLNESFATYMANLALVEATEFKKAWQSFYAGTKQWAYTEDQYVTTHPIEVDIPDTEHASASFDGITYGKGASVLKQIAFFLGAETFRKGVQVYFQDYAYQSATLVDFIGSLEQAADRDLEKWTQDWIRTSSLNTLEAEVSCEGGRVKSFALIQTAPEEYPTIRQHRTQVGLFYLRGEKVQLERAVKVAYSGPYTPVSQLEGEPCPDLIYPNYGDYDFVRVKLDPISVGAARTSLSRVQDPFVRTMLWQSLWDMVKDGEYSLVDYSDLLFANLESEEDIKIIQSVGETIHGEWAGAPAILFYLPRDGAIPSRFVANYKEKLEAFIWRQINRSEPGTDHQKFWYDTFVRIASTSQGEGRLREILAGKIRFEGLAIDQDRRWRIVWSLSAIGSDSVEQLIKSELTRDASERGQQSALGSKAAYPLVANKKKWLREILSPNNEMSLMRKNQILRGIFPYEQQALREDLKGEFYENLPVLLERKEFEFAWEFADNLVPTYCTPGSIKELGSFIDAHPEFPPGVKNVLRIAKQEDERCLLVRSVTHSHILERWNMEHPNAVP